MSVEVASHKIVDLFFGLLMEILKLMHRRELGDVKAIWQHPVRLALEEMLTLICSDVRYCGEDVARVGSGSFDAISMVNASLSRLCVHVEPLQVVVEVDGPSTQVSPQQRSMGSEDRGHIDAPPFRQRQSDPCQPLVEVCDNGLLLLVANELYGISSRLVAPNRAGLTSPRNQATR
jgi:hypothetical protein